MKNRFYILLFISLLTPLGFACKFYNGPYSNWINNSFVNILYVIFWISLIALFYPGRVSPFGASSAAFLFSVIIELSQLSSAEFLQNLRGNLLGRTIFGTSFSFMDIFYNFLGAVVGFALLSFFYRQKP